MALTERLLVYIDAKSGGFVGEAQKAAKATSKLGVDANVASSRLDRLAGSVGMSGTALKAGLVAGAAAAGGALLKFAADGLRSFVNLANEVKNFSRASGASMEVSSRFVAALDDLGVE